MAKVLLAGSEYTDNLLVLWVDDEELKKRFHNNNYRTSGSDAFDPLQLADADITGSGIWLWEGEYDSNEQVWEGSARLANQYEFDMVQCQESPL